MYIFHKSVSLNHHVCKFIISFALIKQGRSENIDNEILQKLLEDGLVEQEEYGVRLSILYYEYEKYSRQLENQVKTS